MIDTRPVVRHRKVRQHQQHPHHEQFQQDYQQHQPSYPKQTSTVYSGDVHHQRIHSSPDQVFVNPQPQSTPIWQRFKTNSNNQLYEHTNKSDDSLELMPTLAMGYENSINKKLQQKRGELRITSDGYFFDQGYNSDNDHDYNNRAYNNHGYGYGYGYDMNGGEVSPGGINRSRALYDQEREYRNRIHPVYDHEFWRSSYENDGVRSKRFNNDLGSYDQYGGSMMHSEKIEARPLINQREKSYEKMVSVEPLKVSSPGDRSDPDRKVNQTNELLASLTPLPQSECRISPVSSNQEEPIQSSQPPQLPQQQQQQIILKSPKRKSFFKKIFNNNGIGKKHDKSSKRNNQHEQTSNLRQHNQVQPNNLNNSMIYVKDLQAVQIQPNNELEPVISTPDIGQDQLIISEPSFNLVTFITNFPIISNIFNKINESSLHPQSKLLLKMVLIFCVLYEINTVFEIIGEWFSIFGSIFNIGSSDVDY